MPPGLISHSMYGLKRLRNAAMSASILTPGSPVSRPLSRCTTSIASQPSRLVQFASTVTSMRLSPVAKVCSESDRYGSAPSSFGSRVSRISLLKYRSMSTFTGAGSTASPSSAEAGFHVREAVPTECTPTTFLRPCTSTSSAKSSFSGSLNPNSDRIGENSRQKSAPCRSSLNFASAAMRSSLRLNSIRDADSLRAANDEAASANCVKSI